MDEITSEIIIYLRPDGEAPYEIECPACGGIANRSAARQTLYVCSDDDCDSHTTLDRKTLENAQEAHRARTRIEI